MSNTPPPLPEKIDEKVTLENGRTVLIRPIKDSDEACKHKFISTLNPEDEQFRFLDEKFRSCPGGNEIECEKELTLIAVAPDANGEPEALGVIRSAIDNNSLNNCFFTLVVHSKHRDLGLGKSMVKKIIKYYREKDIKYLTCHIPKDRKDALEFIETIGFRKEILENGIIEARYNILQN